MSATVTRRVQRLLIVGLAFLVAWQVATLLGAPRRVGVLLGLHGFVLHVVFAKAYTLVPSYFERELAVPWAPAAQLPLSALGVLGLVGEALGGPRWLGVAGAAAWLGGTLLFVGALGWSVRDNPTGRATGTGHSKADRRRVDRFANAFVPVVFAYLVAGAAASLAAHAGLPAPVGGGAAATHLLAAGGATLLVLAIGLRLLPRLLVAHPPWPVVVLVLPAGAVAPALLSGAFLGGTAFVLGAVIEAAAVVGFAGAVWTMILDSDRGRVGVHAVALSAAAGVAGVALGLEFAVRGPTAALAAAHVRLNLLGFLGLTIVGVAYHVYPPAVGELPVSTDRSAAATLWLLAGGLVVEVLGLVTGTGAMVTLGRLGALVGAAGVALIVLGVLARQRG